MRLEGIIDALHARVVKNQWLQRFTTVTRLLLAIAFIPSGLVKVLDIPFTQLGSDTPIGNFFDALYQTGFYYNFIGWAQLSASLLLLIPYTATLGAVVYFPIILNIAVITPSLHFTGTPVITSLMLLASLYLLCWEYDRLKLLVPRWYVSQQSFSRSEYMFEACIWGGLGVVGYTVGAALGIGNIQQAFGGIGVLIAGVAGILFGVFAAWHLRHDRTATSRQTRPPTDEGHVLLSGEARR